MHEMPIQILEEHSDTISELVKRTDRIHTDRGLEDFVSSYLSEQVVEREDGHVEPLCDCKLPTCPLKRGVAPAPLRIRGSGLLRPINTRRRAAEWVLDHPGDARILQEALIERDEAVGEMYARWMQLYNRMKREQWADRLGGSDAQEADAR